MIIEDIQKDPKLADLILVTNSQDVDFIADYLQLKDRTRYGGFFVRVENGEYTKVYGFEGTVPYLWKHVTDLTHLAIESAQRKTSARAIGP